MGTIASNLLPNATGLNLGSPSQRFDVFAQDLTADSINSTSANPATTGTINLASLDTIAWRNAANAADVLLQKSQGAGVLPADTLQWPNGVSAAEFITATASPSTTGVVRLATADAIKFRNNADSGDLNGLSHNSDDTMQVGDTAGIKSGAITSSGTVISGGTFATPSGTNLTVQPQGSAGNSTTVASSAGATGGAVAVTAGAGSAGNGGSVTITAGASAISATGGDVVLVPGAGISLQGACILNGTTTIAKKITSYNGSATIANGVPVQYAQVNSPGLVAAVTTTTLYTPQITGWYRISAILKITTTGTSPVAGPITITYTDGDGSVAQSQVMSLKSVTGTVVTTTVNNSTTTGTVNGTIDIYALTGVAIQYAIAVSGTFGAGVYSAHLRLEELG